jgi:hypothetical protein
MTYVIAHFWWLLAAAIEGALLIAAERAGRA